MRKILVILAILIIFPNIAVAHETRNYKIGDREYQLVVGSLGEPIVVDQKTGVDFGLSLLNGENAIPVTGIEDSLQVEISAGPKTKTQKLAPVFGSPGKYKTSFIPTIDTTYVYRFFGRINGIDIDLSFTCDPAGHPQSQEIRDEITVSPEVTQTFKTGTFGCPSSIETLSFPEKTTSLYHLAQKIDDDRESQSNTLLFFALVLGVIGTTLGIIGFLKKK